MIDEEHTFLALLGFVYLQNARPDKAVVVLGALDVLMPDQPKVLCALALAQVRSERFNRALETLDRLAMAGGVDAAFHLLRAQALGGLARKEEAETAMRAYVQMREAAALAAVAAGPDPTERQ